MPKRIKISPVIQHVTGNRDTVEVEGNTVGECLTDLVRKYPGFQNWFGVENTVAWLVINQEVASAKQLDRQVKDSDDLSIILVVGGG